MTRVDVQLHKASAMFDVCDGAGNDSAMQSRAVALGVESFRLAAALWFLLTLCVHGQSVKDTDGRAGNSPPEKPKAAATVNLVYDAAQADIYYSDMVVENTTDNSFFVPIGWENGYFGVQQFDGENKRAFNFAVWNAANEKGEYSSEPVETLFTGERCVIKRLKAAGGGVQCMRQFDWKVGETNRFAMLAQVQSNKTVYTAWLFDRDANKWERLASFRAVTEGRWLRGYYSFVEDFRRDYTSVNDVRRARFPNVWIHQDGGTYLPITKAMFVSSGKKTEAKDDIDGGQSQGAFTLATGGGIKSQTPVGAKIVLSDVPFKQPQPPDLWFLYGKPKL